jgi:uncharacterized protein YfiM (DUF2279 family)
LISQSTSATGAPPGLFLNSARRLARGLGALPRASGLVLAALWYALIWGMSSGSSVGRIGPIQGYWLLNTGHSLIFGLLGLWLSLCLPRRGNWPVVSRRGVLFVLGTILLLGTLDEWHQSFVPGRTTSAADVCTDLTGAACVLWICAFAGSAAADERGLRRRLLACVAFCFAAGGMASLSDWYWGF